jgi:hypothetical protein
VTGSKTPTPFRQIYSSGMTTEGGRCTPGHYCPKGALAPIPCPEGTYNPNPGQAECTNCPKGQYCSGIGLTKITKLCSETYYCDEGSSSPTPYKCQSVLDGYCPQGTVILSQCLDGSYLQDDGKCYPCPAGKKCTSGGVVACPAGHFCGDNQNFPYGQLCPNGTYSDLAGLKSASECQQCPTKYYCLAGKVIDQCNAGYICLQGANSPTPVNSSGAFPCPLGYYCGLGISTP